MASSVRPKSDRRKTTTTRSAKPLSDSYRVPQSEIARRAFELYCARGGADGHALEDWLRAERELMAGSAAEKRKPARPTAIA